MREGDRLERITATYAACHLVVDFACIATVVGVAAPRLGLASLGNAALAILTYDLVAFCLQLPLGALLDVLGRRLTPSAALLSFALVASGVSCAQASGTAAACAAILLVALGNALFHCVGGVEVLGESAGAAAPAGLFICTGAGGVFLGSLGGITAWTGLPWLLLALLVGCAALVLLAPHDEAAGGLSFALGRMGWLAVALLAATVALRSYTGMVMGFPWKVSLPLAALAVVAVIAGKAAGGLLSDRIGAAPCAALSLGMAALLFLPSWTSAPAGLAAAFLFNFSMAITLSELAVLLPEARGMAFGIASFALALGALPALLGLRVDSGAALALLSLASLALLELGLACRQGERRGRRTTTVHPRARH